MTATNIVFCDNDILSREAIKILLMKMPDINIIGEFDNSREIINQSIISFPEIILFDLQCNTVNDILQIQQIKLKYPDSKLIVISTFDDLRTITSAFKIGAIGFLIKRNLSVSELSKAINYAKENNHYISGCSDYKMENINKILQLNYEVSIANQWI